MTYLLNDSDSVKAARTVAAFIAWALDYGILYNDLDTCWSLFHAGVAVNTGNRVFLSYNDRANYAEFINDLREAGIISVDTRASSITQLFAANGVYVGTWISFLRHGDPFWVIMNAEWNYSCHERMSPVLLQAFLLAGSELHTKVYSASDDYPLIATYIRYKEQDYAV